MIDIIIFLLVNFGLFVAFIVALEYYWYVGPIAGLFGAVFSLEMFNSGSDLILRSFLNADGEIINATMPLGYFFYVPVILSLLCLATGFKRRR